MSKKAVEFVSEMASRRKNAFNRAFRLFEETKVYKQDHLFAALCVARDVAKNDPDTRLYKKIDDLAWARIGEIQKRY